MPDTQPNPRDENKDRTRRLSPREAGISTISVRAMAISLTVAGAAGTIIALRLPGVRHPLVWGAYLQALYMGAIILGLEVALFPLLPEE